MKKQILTLAAINTLALGVLAAPTPTEVEVIAAATPIVSNFISGNWNGVYTALPQSTRANISEFTKIYAKQTDSGTWNSMSKLIYQIAATTAKQSEFVVRNMTEKVGITTSQSQKAAAQSVLVGIASKLAAVTRSSTQENIAKGGLEQILSSPALTMSGVTDKSIAYKPDLVCVGTKNGVVYLADKKFPNTKVGFVKVDGQWIPETLNITKQDLAKAAKQEQMDDNTRQMVNGFVIPMVENMFKQAGRAQTYEEFNNVFSGAMQLIDRQF